MRLASLLVLSAMTATLIGCSDSGTATPQSEPKASAAPPAAAQPPSAATPAATDAAQAMTDRIVVVPGALFTLPEGWVQQPPSASMRLAQAAIPGEAGAGELTVFHFGAGGGGGVEANLQRWANQVQPDPGTGIARDSFTLGAWNVSWIEVAGTLKPSSMGVGPSEPVPGSRLLAAVVEGPGGPWFFKATGPDATIAAQRDAFLDMLKTGRTHG